MNGTPCSENCHRTQKVSFSCFNIQSTSVAHIYAGLLFWNPLPSVCRRSFPRQLGSFLKLHSKSEAKSLEEMISELSPLLMSYFIHAGLLIQIILHIKITNVSFNSQQSLRNEIIGSIQEILWCSYKNWWCNSFRFDGFFFSFALERIFIDLIMCFDWLLMLVLNHGFCSMRAE